MALLAGVLIPPASVRLMTRLLVRRKAGNGVLIQAVPAVGVPPADPVVQ